ncbi:hypothetical protein J6590_098960 [Homalodisca vitripennis]|nr:hypothetical protein J6590_098960 [Homalodisca vitripennis]
MVDTDLSLYFVTIGVASVVVLAAFLYRLEYEIKFKTLSLHLMYTVGVIKKADQPSARATATALTKIRGGTYVSRLCVRKNHTTASRTEGGAQGHKVVNKPRHVVSRKRLRSFHFQDEMSFSRLNAILKMFYGQTGNQTEKKFFSLHTERREHLTPY